MRCLPALALSLGIFGASTAFAQGMPQMPTPQEIDRRIQEEMDKLPVRKVEHEVMTIEYREMPTDITELVKRAAGGQVPQGVNIDQLMKQYMPMARPYVEKHAAKLGTVKVTKSVKCKSLTLKPDEIYDFGLVLDGTVPIGILIGGPTLKAAAKIPLKGMKNDQTFDPMEVRVEAASEKSDKKLNVVVGFAAVLGAAGTFDAKE